MQRNRQQRVIAQPGGLGTVDRSQLALDGGRLQRIGFGVVLSWPALDKVKRVARQQPVFGGVRVEARHNGEPVIIATRRRCTTIGPYLRDECDVIGYAVKVEPGRRQLRAKVARAATAT